MPQSLIHQQKLTQEQIQQQSAMQVLAAKLTELPLEGLLERVKNELNENPYLESTKSESGEDIYPNQEESSHDTYDPKQDYSSDEDIPEYLLAQSSKNDIEAEGSNIDFSDSQSFYEQLMEQAREYKLTEHERQILEYIIGNLDDDGLLSKPLYQLSDELQIYHYCDATIEEMERMLQVLWQFEPAGVGARSLQECLIIQCKRKGHHHSAGSPRQRHSCSQPLPPEGHPQVRHLPYLRGRAGGRKEPAGLLHGGSPGRHGNLHPLRACS